VLYADRITLEGRLELTALPSAVLLAKPCMQYVRTSVTDVSKYRRQACLTNQIHLKFATQLVQALIYKLIWYLFLSEAESTPGP